MRIVAWEVDKNPASSVREFQVLQLFIQADFFSFKGLNLLLLDVLLVKLILDSSQTLVNFDVTLGLLLELLLLGLGILVRVLHS